VLINGGSIAIEWVKNNIPAIVAAGYPGENGAQAIAEILFGDYNPGGNDCPYPLPPPNTQHTQHTNIYHLLRQADSQYLSCQIR